MMTLELGLEPMVEPTELTEEMKQKVFDAERDLNSSIFRKRQRAKAGIKALEEKVKEDNGND